METARLPARLVVPGLYGYVSATKWLKEIELATWDGFDGYWIPRGWDKEGPILTQARIDRPNREGSITAGSFTLGGVAWAPTRLIDRVEVQIDDGPWVEAELAESLSDASWRLWKIEWDEWLNFYHRASRRLRQGPPQALCEFPESVDGALGSLMTATGAMGRPGSPSISRNSAKVSEIG